MYWSITRCAEDASDNVVGTASDHIQHVVPHRLIPCVMDYFKINHAFQERVGRDVRELSRDNDHECSIQML